MDELEQLGQLGQHDVDPAVAARIRARAHEAIARRTRPLSKLRRAYRMAEPVIVSALAASYIVWAFRTVFP